MASAWPWRDRLAEEPKLQNAPPSTGTTGSLHNPGPPLVFLQFITHGHKSAFLPLFYLLRLLSRTRPLHRPPGPAASLGLSDPTVTASSQHWWPASFPTVEPTKFPIPTWQHIQPCRRRDTRFLQKSWAICSPFRHAPPATELLVGKAKCSPPPPHHGGVGNLQLPQTPPSHPPGL